MMPKYSTGEMVIIQDDFDDYITGIVSVIFPHSDESYLYIIKSDDGANRYRYEGSVIAAEIDLTELLAI